MTVLVLVGGGQVGPVVPLSRLAVVDDMRVPMRVGYRLVLVVRKLMSPAFVRLWLAGSLFPLASVIRSRTGLTLWSSFNLLAWVENLKSAPLGRGAGAGPSGAVARA